jgi:hypothetical protein
VPSSKLHIKRGSDSPRDPDCKWDFGSERAFDSKTDVPTVRLSNRMRDLYSIRD